MSPAHRRGSAQQRPGGSRRASRPVPTVTVRPAVADDLDTLVTMRLALLREHAGSPIYGRLRRDADGRARVLFASQIDAPDEACFVAEHDGTPVGCLRVAESRGSPLLLPARYGYLASAYVTPPARRLGVLRQLVDHGLAWCRARGLLEVRLHADAVNLTAGAAWEALGFTVVEHLRHRVLMPEPGESPPVRRPPVQTPPVQAPP